MVDAVLNSQHVQIIALSSSHITSTSMPTFRFFSGWMPFLLSNQQCQSTEGKALMFLVDQHKGHSASAATITIVFPSHAA